MTTADPGSRLLEELVLLLDALAHQAGPWLDRVAAGHDGHRDSSDLAGEFPDLSAEVPLGGDTGPHAAGADHSCVLCAVAALLTGKPNELAAETLARLAEAVAVLRAVLADRWWPQNAPHLPGFRPAGWPDRAERDRSTPRSTPATERGAEAAARVQRIAVRWHDDPS